MLEVEEEVEEGKLQSEDVSSSLLMELRNIINQYYLLYYLKTNKFL